MAKFNIEVELDDLQKTYLTRGLVETAEFEVANKILDEVKERLLDNGKEIILQILNTQVQRMLYQLVVDAVEVRVKEYTDATIKIQFKDHDVTHYPFDCPCQNYIPRPSRKRCPMDL